VTIIAYPDHCSPQSQLHSKGKEKKGPEDNDGGVEVVINPAHILRMGYAKAKDLMLSVGMKENHDLACKANETSSERLVWGRIFAKSIVHHMEFTLDVSDPPSLPVHADTECQIVFAVEIAGFAI
jgi:hypothetical protein